MELMKHAGRIGRDYHSQALYAVALCRELAGRFERPAYQTEQSLKLLEA